MVGNSSNYCYFENCLNFYKKCYNKSNTKCIAEKAKNNHSLVKAE